MTVARHRTRGSGAQIPVQPAVRQRLPGARLPRGDRKEEEKQEELRLGFASGVTSDSHGRRPVRRDGRDEEKPVGQERQRPGRFHPQTSSRGRGPGPTCPRRPPHSSARSAAGPRPGIRSPAAPRPRHGPFLPRPMAPVGRGAARWRSAAARRLTSLPATAGGGGRREKGCRDCPLPTAAPGSAPYLGRRGGRRGHQHGASTISAAQPRPLASLPAPAVPAGGGERRSDWAESSADAWARVTRAPVSQAAAIKLPAYACLWASKEWDKRGTSFQVEDTRSMCARLFFP